MATVMDAVIPMPELFKAMNFPVPRSTLLPRRLTRWFPALLLIGVVASARLSAASSPVVREPGVTYLSDILDKPPKLKLLKPTDAFFSQEMNRYAGTLRVPQTVEVLAVHDEVCRVRARAQQGQILGWIPVTAVEGLTPERLSELREMEKRRQMIEKLIEANEVAIGMTTEDVRRSLGRPQKVTHKADEDGTVQVLEYIRYRNVVRQVQVNTVLGPVFQNVVEKVPVGMMTIRCKENVVVGLEMTES